MASFEIYPSDIAFMASLLKEAQKAMESNDDPKGPIGTIEAEDKDGKTRIILDLSFPFPGVVGIVAQQQHVETMADAFFEGIDLTEGDSDG